MFKHLLECKTLNVFKEDEELARPRQYTVIFSSFYKILYKREKLAMLRAFQQSLVDDYIDFSTVVQSQQRVPQALQQASTTQL